MRIYQADEGAVYVNAISKTAKGEDVEGHMYLAITGPNHSQTLLFQQGTVPEAGHNGLTNELLLAVLVHRIKFLNGKFPCRENSLAITKLEEAKMWLEERTRNRIERGVEGKHEA